MALPGKTFDGLLPEIKANIIDHISRPTDLRNLCLVTKQLHELAVKPLYRTLCFDLGSPTDTRLSAFLHPRNKGLQHVRVLNLRLVSERPAATLVQQANFATRMILEFLPEDVLEEFWWAHAWCPWDAFSADNLLLLYRKQRRMKWLDVVALDRNVVLDLKAQPKLQDNIFRTARRVALYPADSESIEMCRFYMEKMSPVLEDLVVYTKFPHEDSRNHSPERPTVPSTREINDSATGPGLLMRTIFAHLLPFDKTKTIQNLTSISLHHVNLRFCADTWCQIVPFTNIVDLSVYSCTGADALLSQLSRCTDLPKRLETFKLQHKDNEDNETLMALDGFLCQVSGIKHMVIDIEHVASLPAASGIAKHGKTLKTLNVHCSAGSGYEGSVAGEHAEELVWDGEDFTIICKASRGLEQLSCAWPATSLVKRHGEKWRAYEIAATHLKNLVTLNITTFPGSKACCHILLRVIYETLLQALACRLFEVIRNLSGETLPKPPSPAPPTGLVTIIPVDITAPGPPPTGPPATSKTDASPPGKIRLIAFGISDKIYERADSANQIIYLRSTCLDAENRTRIHATPISWCLRQFVEPRSDILDFILHRDVKGPWRERDGPTPWAHDDELDF